MNKKKIMIHKVNVLQFKKLDKQKFLFLAVIKTNQIKNPAIIHKF